MSTQLRKGDGDQGRERPRTFGDHYLLTLVRGVGAAAMSGTIPGTQWENIFSGGDCHRGGGLVDEEPQQKAQYIVMDVVCIKQKINSIKGCSYKQNNF